LCIDESDASAKNRSSESGEKTGDVLTALLTEMDGFKSNADKPVFVLAATNYSVEQSDRRSLDPAILRRFDRKILVDLPDKQEREQYLKMKMQKNPALALSATLLENVASRAVGSSIAELELIIELAIRNSIKKGENVVTDEIFENAFETYMNGEEKKWERTTVERTARHEAGHALLCWLSGETPSYLTIVSRGNHGGYMQHADGEDKMLYTRKELLGRIRTSLAGRAAELVCYGEEDGVSTGASGDLNSATRLAEYMICAYGMDETVGLGSIDLASISGSAYYTTVRNRVNEVLKEQLILAKKAVVEHKKAFDALVSALLEKSHLTGKEIDSILSKNSK
jgi:ATP-dependent Zn protease